MKKEKQTTEIGSAQTEEELERAKNNFVSLQNIEKIYPNGGKAVYSLNLDIREKEFVVIVGPSGCGKSTTLRMIGGLENISSGKLFINGEFSNFTPCKDRKMAMVFQSYALYPQMTVFDNIAFPLRINKYRLPKTDKKILAAEQLVSALSAENFARTARVVKDSADSSVNAGKPADFVCARLSVKKEVARNLLSLNLSDSEKTEGVRRSAQKTVDERRAHWVSQGYGVGENGTILKDGEVLYEEAQLDADEINRRVFYAADILDLGAYLDRLPKQLSGGQMQRVALGRAIVKDVPLFLMDEPLSNLDAKLRMSMRSEIVKLHNRLNATTVYVTHDQTEAMTMATRVVVMSRGFIQQIDTPKEIYNNPRNLFVAKFIGSPSINTFECILEGNELVLPDGVRIVLDKRRFSAMEAFFREEEDKMRACAEGFSDERASGSAEYIRKIESAFSIGKSSAPKVKERNAFVAKLRKLFAGKEKAPAEIPEKAIALQKLNALEEGRSGGRRVIAGIRPENLVLSKKTKGDYTSRIVLSELLGAEYNIYFDLFGKGFVAKAPVGEAFDNGDEIAVSFSMDHILLFDAVTGDRIP